jgi:hypothetical protein
LTWALSWTLSATATCDGFFGKTVHVAVAVAVNAHDNVNVNVNVNDHG